MSKDLFAPGDRRRFAFYAAKRNLTFEIVEPRDDLDVVVLSSVADITRWRSTPTRTAVVYDLVDSYLALSRLHWRSLGRGAAKRLSGETRTLAFDYQAAIKAMCRRADAVVCSTIEQASQISRLCLNTHVILDYHGDDVLATKTDYAAKAPFRIVWEGLPYTLGAFASLRDAFRRLGQRSDMEVHLVTDLEYRAYAGRFVRRRTERLAARSLVTPFQLHPWSAQTLSEVAPRCDLAVIPADLGDPFSAGKPENRLLLFWRMGLPVVTSATPAYRRAMEHAEAGRTCASTDEWVAAMSDLMADEGARAKAGRQGLRYASHYGSEERLLRQWDRVFEGLGFER